MLSLDWWRGRGLRVGVLCLSFQFLKQARALRQVTPGGYPSSSLATTCVTGLVRSLAWVFQEHTPTRLIPPSPHREQRLTGLVVFVLTGVSIFLAPVLKVLIWPASGPVQHRTDAGWTLKSVCHELWFFFSHGHINLCAD